jgi:NAD(P)-dependent dehydrogenase (short-subunit alcohol dehydrogenase family)
MGRLQGKNILITGGSNGIGLASARAFHNEGANVAICGLDEQRLKDAATSIGADTVALQADVSRISDLDNLFAELLQRGFTQLDAIFVNAGVSQFEPLVSVTEETFDNMVGVNLKGAFFTVQKALPLLRPGSSVVLDASVVARKGWPGCTVVSAMKAGLVSLAKTMSAELLESKGIRVNSLSPGPTDTAMFGRIPGEETGDSVKDMHRANNPSRRIATPEEIAHLAVYLVSDESSYVVGADFAIDGGVGSISNIGA